MESKKGSSIEWLYERLERMIPNSALYNIDKKLYLEEAKEKHEKEIIDAFSSGDSNGTFETISAEQYYNQKFNQ
jgi:hypothetical protein